MLTNQTNPFNMVDPNQRDLRAWQPMNDGNGGYTMIDPHFWVRGQAGPQGTATFAASAASGSTQLVTLTLEANQIAPSACTLVLINHTDVAVSFTVAQTVNDFVAGTGTQTPIIFTSTTNVTAAGSESVQLTNPYTTDGPIIVTFTITAVSTLGGKVGAQLRWN